MNQPKTSGDIPMMTTKDVFQLVGGYPVVRILGEGGMGRVFACRDQSLGRMVAIKMLLPERAKDPTMVARFLHEARAMARVSSPHVVPIFHVGQEGDTPYMVMEYLEGEDLDRLLLSRGPVSETDALQYIREAAEGLRAANNQGLIHRDVKPANLFLSQGHIKLLDFGLARLLDSDQRFTQHGLLIGSPHFMPPERVKGLKEDHRSDIYGLGITFFTIMKGRPPFDSKRAADIFTWHVAKPLPDFAQELPQTSQKTRNILTRMLARNAEERYQTYDELLADLGAPASVVSQPPAPQAAVAPGPTPQGSDGSPPRVLNPGSSVEFAFTWAQQIRNMARKRMIVIGILAIGIVFVGWLAAGGGGKDKGSTKPLLAVDPLAGKADLKRGHELAKAGKVKEATAAYGVASRKGVVDAQLMDFALTHMPDDDADDGVVDMLIRWPDKGVTEPLRKRLGEEGWRVRHRALRILRERKDATPQDEVAVAVKDLALGTKCDSRRKGLDVLKEHGNGAEVLEAVQQARKRMPDNACMERELQELEAALKTR